MNRRTAIPAAVAVAAGWGLVGGWWTPRGPLTTAEALWSILISLAVGVAAGFLARSRWAMAFAPVAFALAFELVRIGLDGPTVDGIETSTYGILALIVGRVFHGLLSLFPMAIGAAFGAGVARRSVQEEPRSDRRFSQIAGRVAFGFWVAILVVLTLGVARPSRTAAIVDSDGDVIAGSVAELTTVDVNGHDLVLMIRGHDTDNPVLLFLAGGPGGSELGAMRNHLRELERHFTVVTWDQRGAGKSYRALDPTDTITLDGYVKDTDVVTDYLRRRFGQDRIYLFGQSWGSTLGVLAVQQHPEKYRAFIGVGQMVSQLETDTIFYNDTLRWARANGKDSLEAELVSIGPPPYERMLDYETALSYEHDIYPYDHRHNAEGEGGFSENLIAEEYALIDQAHLLGAFMDTFSALYPKLQDIDFRESATTFEIPMFFVQGAHEADGRAEPFDEWYPSIDAPIKDLVVLETSGHRPLWEQPEEFVDYMVGTVLEQAS